MTKSIEYAASAATTNQDAMIQAMRRQGLRNVARYWQRREERLQRVNAERYPTLFPKADKA